MITIKNKMAIEKMATAGRILAQMFLEIPDIIKPGISTLEIDSWISKKLQENKMISKTKGYKTYNHSSCISINEEVVHGVPQDSKKIKKGDLVKVDVCASYSGYCADMTRCFFVGTPPSDSAKKLVDVAYESLDAGINLMCPGNFLTDISAAIQQVVEKNGFGVVRDFAGHGIGKSMHEDPEILNYGKPGRGIKLLPGMTFALEPMITMGSYKIIVENDGWTARTVDKSLAAHVEDTILITENGPQILTRL